MVYKHLSPLMPQRDMAHERIVLFSSSFEYDGRDTTLDKDSVEEEVTL